MLKHRWAIKLLFLVCFFFVSTTSIDSMANNERAKIISKNEEIKFLCDGKNAYNTTDFNCIQNSFEPVKIGTHVSTSQIVLVKAQKAYQAGLHERLSRLVIEADTNS